jgi:hypothetical protein
MATKSALSGARVPALPVAENLMGGRLADVEDRLAGQVMRLDLRYHGALPLMLETKGEAARTLICDG